MEEWFKEAWDEERDANKEFREDVCARLGKIETWIEVRAALDKKERERGRALLGVLGLLVAVASVLLPLILR